MGVEGLGISEVDVMPLKSGLGGGQSAINQYCWIKAKCRGRRAQPYSTSLHGAQPVARRERAQIKGE